MSSRTQSDESDELEELPPLDEPGAGDPEGPLEDEALPLLTPFEEDVDLDEDASEADVDLGLTVEEAASESDEPGEVVLDMTELLSLADQDDHPEEGDTAGPANLDIGADMDVDGAELLGSTEEGTDEPLEDLVSETLPELDADEPGGLDEEPSWLALDALRDEDLPPRAEGWKVSPLSVRGADWSALCRTSSGVVAGGRTLAFLGAQSETLPAEHARVIQLANAGSSGVVCLTARAELVVVAPGGTTSPISGWREALGVSTSEPLELALADSGAETPGSLALHAFRSSVVQSDDEGATFTCFELGGALSAMSSGDSPIRLLAKTSDGHAVCVWDGANWTRQPLDPSAEEVADGERPLLVSRGDVVAIATAERGLVVSTDSGRGFSRVPGCLHATAMAIGSRGSRTKVWVAVFMESEERALVIEVDCASRRAAVVAELAASGEDVSDVDARIEALVWDPNGHTLLAACNDALFSLSAPAD